MTLIIYNGSDMIKPQAHVEMPSFPILISMNLLALTLNNDR